MNANYTAEKHTQILISLLKQYGIRKIIASPGTTNLCLVASLQNDPFFEIYSSVDERSAAFIAVGMAAESGKPVALSCTESTASRNYIPGLTEAYYRKLPILAITSSPHLGRVGHYYGQVIDRSSPLADIVNESVNVDCIYTDEDEWECIININKALLSLGRNGGGPSHINLVSTYSKDYSCKQLPEVKKITYISSFNEMPALDKYKHIAVLIGVHSKMSSKLKDAIENFCNAYDAVVINNHASNYTGDFGYNPDLILNMKNYEPSTELPDLVIYIGSVSRYASGMKAGEMWRVNPDGEIRDREKKLTKVFAMEEEVFFNYYSNLRESTVNNYATQWQNEYNKLINRMPELPFCNVWIASILSKSLPDDSVLHLAGSNTARAWNFFQIPKSVECYSNDGTMGIDGQVSALIGESLANPSKIHFGAVGDLTFFYDMNSLGNRHIGNNVRLLIVNNGKGAEFKLYSHDAFDFREQSDSYIAAAGHFGNKSTDLVKHYAQDLGFEYLTASTKEEFLKVLDRFVTPKKIDRSIIFEVFTDDIYENEGIYAMNHIASNISGLVSDAPGKVKSIAKDMIKAVAGEKGISAVKILLKK